MKKLLYVLQIAAVEFPEGFSLLNTNYKVSPILLQRVEVTDRRHFVLGVC